MHYIYLKELRAPESTAFLANLRSASLFTLNLESKTVALLTMASQRLIDMLPEPKNAEKKKLIVLSASRSVSR